MVPDILTLSKTLGAGIPLAATVTSKEIEESCYEKGFSYYTSHLSDPMPAEVGLAVLNVLREEKLAERAAEIGPYVMTGLKELQSRHESIGDVRGIGLFIGVEFVTYAASMGVFHHHIASQNPWQQGRTESVGGSLKEDIRDVVEECAIVLSLIHIS